MGAGCPDRDVSYVSTDGAGYRPRKTKAMVCTPGFISGEWGELAYKWQETGDNSTFRDQKKTRMRFSTCSVTVAASYLKANMARSHGICVHQTRGGRQRRGRADHIRGVLTQGATRGKMFSSRVPSGGIWRRKIT